jgi:glycosyltransferase involved in cell wall biosynthesis
MNTIAIDIRLIGRNRTGDETVFFNLVRELAAYDRDNRYLLLTDRCDGDFLSDLRTKLGIGDRENFVFVSLRARNRFSWNLFAVPFFLLRNRIDIFHTQYILPAFIPKRTKVAAHIHDVSFRAFPDLIGWKDRLFLTLLIPRTMRRADLLIAPSRFTKDEIVKYYGVKEEKVVVVTNAVSGAFATVKPDPTTVRERYSLPETYILSVGTLQPRKNIPLLIRAFSSLDERLPEAKLVIVGNKSSHHYDREIDVALSESKHPERIVFPGFVDSDDLPSVYRRARVFAVPSRYEGFGIPLLEAFASGVPVTASAILPFQEVGGDAILAFPPDSVAECAETLYTLFTNETLRKTLIERGNERLSVYSWAASARDLLSCYESLYRGGLKRK